MHSMDARWLLSTRQSIALTSINRGENIPALKAVATERAPSLA